MAKLGIVDISNVLLAESGIDALMSILKADNFNLIEENIYYETSKYLIESELFDDVPKTSPIPTYSIEISHNGFDGSYSARPLQKFYAKR